MKKWTCGCRPCQHCSRSTMANVNHASGGPPSQSPLIISSNASRMLSSPSMGARSGPTKAMTAVYRASGVIPRPIVA